MLVSAYMCVCVCVCARSQSEREYCRGVYSSQVRPDGYASPQMHYFTHTSCLISQCRREIGAYNSFAMHSYAVYISTLWLGLKKPCKMKKSSTCLNRDRTLHTNGTARVLQVSKTLDLFFRNKSVKNLRRGFPPRLPPQTGNTCIARMR